MWLHMLILSGFDDNRSFLFTQLRQHIGETEWARREKEFYNPSELRAFAERKVKELDKYDEALEKLERKLLMDSGDMAMQDLQSNNILLGIDNEENSILSKFEQAEFNEPVPRKIFENRTIHLPLPLPISYGTPVLWDLSSARLGTNQQEGDTMPDIHRGPDVILQMSWDYKVDIWSVGLLMWDLLERRHLFRARNSAGNLLDDGFHLAKMHAVLGSPPLKFLRQSERSYEYWDEKGNWKGAAPIPESNLETLEENLMKRMTFYIFFGECYASAQKKDRMLRSSFLILG